jgi:hypothetical protein
MNTRPLAPVPRAMAEADHAAAIAWPVEALSLSGDFKLDAVAFAEESAHRLAIPALDLVSPAELCTMLVALYV